MKKIVSLLALAAILLVGCDKSKKNEGGTLPPPINKDVHTSIIFETTNPPVINPSGEPDHLEKASISSDHTIVAAFHSYGMVECDYSLQTRAVAVGTKYIVSEVGSFEIASVSGNDVEVKFRPEIEGLPELTLKGHFASERFADCTFCRDWTIEETTISAKGAKISSDLAVGKVFKGCSIREISQYLIEKGVKIEEQPSSRDIRGISLFEDGGFAILFKGEKPYYGEFDLGDNNKFEYEFEFYEEDDPVIAGSAVGSFIIANGKGKLNVTGTCYDKDGSSYEVSIIFILKPVSA